MARRITLDLDPTDDPTHGAQQLTFFNRHYDTWCYQPVMGFMSFNDEKEQYLFTAVLRPGNAVANVGAIGILWRILQKLRRAFPQACLRVRLDGGFADPLLLTFLDAMGVEYVVAMAKNAVLNRLAEPTMQQARKLSEESGQTEHLYGEGRYSAESWLLERRVTFEAEVVGIENRLRELHRGLEVDRTSCSKFWASQLRVLMTAAV
ncbi:MAG: transposase [Terriglobia bacterium]